MAAVRAGPLATGHRLKVPIAELMFRFQVMHRRPLRADTVLVFEVALRKPGFRQDAVHPPQQPGEAAIEHLWKFRGVKNGKMLGSHVSLRFRFVWLGLGECY